MGFYRETTIKKPRKKYKCSLCLQDIEGEHTYVAYNGDGGIVSHRAHTRCFKVAEHMCSNCEFRGDCQGSVTECFQERLRKVSKGNKTTKKTKRRRARK